MLSDANTSALLMRCHNHTQHTHETFITEELRVLLVVPGRLYASSQMKAWPSSPGLEQMKAVHVVSRDAGGIQAS